jgi:hypothetical protein
MAAPTKGRNESERERGRQQRVLILRYIGFRSCKNEMKTLICPLGYNAAAELQRPSTIIKTFCLLVCIGREIESFARAPPFAPVSLKTFGENENTFAARRCDVYFTVVVAQKK